METEEQKLRGRALLQQVMQQLREPVDMSDSVPAQTADDDGFFTFTESAPSSVSMTSEMDLYLVDPSKEISSLSKWTDLDNGEADFP